MSPNDADEMANSVDPDQTAPLGAVWSGSALFAQAYLSENLGSLRYLYPISGGTELKIIMRVTFLESVLPLKNFGMDFRFSVNNGNMKCRCTW